MQDVLIVLIIFGVFFGGVYLFCTTRHRERLALIDKMEKGADASLFKTGTKTQWPLIALFFGMLAVGVSLGVVCAALIQTASHVDEEIIFPAMIFLFGGGSLILYYFLIKKQDNNKE